MTDEELIEKLREWWEYDHGHLISKAADRIEELRRRALIAESKVVTIQIGIQEILEKWVSPVEKRGMN